MSKNKAFYRYLTVSTAVVTAVAIVIADDMFPLAIPMLVLASILAFLTVTEP